MTTPVIETPRLILRPFAKAHLTERYIGWLNNPEIVRFSENRHRKHSMESCRTYLGSMIAEGHMFWAVHEKGRGDVHVGNVTAYLDKPNEVADVAIMIGEVDAQGCGLGSEAWCAVIHYLAEERKMRRIQAGTMVRNAPMRALFRKSGMLEEGRQRERFLLDGQPIDMVFAARLCSDDDKRTQN